MPAFTARPSRWRLVLLLLAGVGFVVLGAWVAGLLGDPPKPGKEWAGWLGILFFSACVPILAMRLFDNDDQVRIDQRGIHSKQWSADIIPWSEISDVNVWQLRRERLIVLHLRDATLFPSTTLLGKLAAANRAMTGGDISISLAGTDGRFDDAIAAIGHYFRAA